MSFQIEWNENDAYVKFYGELTFQDFHDANGKIYGNHRFDHMKYQIADFTDVSSINLTAYEVKIISTLEKGALCWNESVKVAHVTKDKYLRELVYTYEESMKDTNWVCRLFEELDEAKDWCTGKMVHKGN